MLRGEIWTGIWPNDPDQKPRPLLIISNNHRNQASRLLDIVVVKLTSLHDSQGNEKATNQAEDVMITLKKQTIIRCASIFTIEKGSIKRKISQLSLADMNKVDSCLKVVLDLN